MKRRQHRRTYVSQWDRPEETLWAVIPEKSLELSYAICDPQNIQCVLFITTRGRMNEQILSAKEQSKAD